MTFWLSLLLAFVCYFSIFFIETFIIKNVLPPLTLLGSAFVSLYFFREQSLYVPMAMPLIAGGLTMIHGYLHTAVIEGRQRRMMQGTLSKYLSPTVTQHLIDSGVNPTAEVGKWREISILFSDIRGFTSLSETIAPDFLVRILNEYLGEMTDLIFERDGTLDKFIGDAVMAFWGAPLDDADHARKSVNTAVQMVRALDAFNERHRTDGYPQLKIGIGVHTGKAIVGNIGSNKRLDYTIIGDNVNLASRLEGLTKEYHVSLLISGSTYELVKDYFICRPIDVVVAKGKTQSVPLYQPLIERKPGANTSQQETLCYLFSEAFKLYQQGQFNWALESFRKVLEKFPEDGPTLTYIERCETLIETPPVQWQGVYVATRK
jgi:adenylate cyclase